MKEQSTLFDKRPYRGTKPQTVSATAPSADQTVQQTLPAYRTYLGSVSRSEYTPDDFTADVRLFGQYTSPRPLSELQTVDIQQWIGKLKETMQPKSVGRKIAALGNYFRWLETEGVLDKNPGLSLRAPKLTAPLPDILFDNECDALLKAASSDPRPYFLIKLLLETGIKTAELRELRTTNFDFSDKYEPELWIKHTGQQVVKDRKLKLQANITSVYEDYMQRYGITDVLFPYSDRFMQRIIKDAAKAAGLRKEVSPRLLRDMFVIRCRKRGEAWDTIFDKIGLSKESRKDALRKYGRLTSEAL